MEENNEIIEEQKKDEEIVSELAIEGSKNVFIYDRPVGRLWFFCTIVGLIIILIPITYLYSLYLSQYATHSLLPLSIALNLLIMLFSLWIQIINIAKRLYDLLGDKKKGIFYAIAFYLFCLIAANIPSIKYIFILFLIVYFVFLLFVPGKLIK